MSLRDLLDLVLPLECAACRRPGRRWCVRCDRALQALAAGERSPRVVVEPGPPGFPAVHAWGEYAEPLRSGITAWKDAGRRDLADRLAPLLRSAVEAAAADAGWCGGPVLVVPAPSSRRSARVRGDVPLLDLARSALALEATGLHPTERAALRLVDALAHTRPVVDQAGLGTVARRVNLSEAMAVKPLWRNVIHGRRCIVVDDVVTTGATLAEAAEALREGGARGVVGATVAATRRRAGDSPMRRM